MAEEGGVAGETGEGGLGGVGVFAGEAAGAFEAVEFHEGGLVGAGVFASGFAEGRAVGGGVENIVHDLKRETEFAAERAEGGERFGGRVGGGEAAHDERGFDHGGGLVEVDELELGGCGVGFFLGEEVFDLAADEALAAGGDGEFAGERETGRGGVAGREEFEGVGEQGVAGEEGGGFVEGFVAGGATAAEVVVVHAGEVVVDQRVGVYALDGDGGGEGIESGRTGELRRGQKQDGAEAFAAGLKTVAHGLVQARGAGGGRRQESVEGGFDLGDGGLEAGGEGHREAGRWRAADGRER